MYQQWEFNDTTQPSQYAINAFKEDNPPPKPPFFAYSSEGSDTSLANAEYSCKSLSTKRHGRSSKLSNKFDSIRLRLRNQLKNNKSIKTTIGIETSANLIQKAIRQKLLNSKRKKKSSVVQALVAKPLKIVLRKSKIININKELISQTVFSKNKRYMKLEFQKQIAASEVHDNVNPSIADETESDPYEFKAVRDSIKVVSPKTACLTVACEFDTVKTELRRFKEKWAHRVNEF